MEISCLERIRIVRQVEIRVEQCVICQMPKGRAIGRVRPTGSPDRPRRLIVTSESPQRTIQGGFQSNVIPSEATATLDIRALPDENMPEFYDLMRKVINDPAVELVPNGAGRPQGVPISITSDVFKALESSFKTVYGIPTVPLMGTGATDMSQLRPRGVQCYGVGAMRDDEDVLKGFGAHSDQERILEESVYKHLQFYWNAVTAIAGAKF